MENRLLKRTFATARLVSGIILSSVFVYIALALWFIDAPVGNAGIPMPLFRHLIYGLAVVQIFAIIVLRRRMLKPTRRLSEEDIANSQRLFTRTLVSFALSEAVAIYGFVLFLLTGNDRDLWLMAGTALVLMILFFPVYDRWLTHFHRMRSRRPGGKPMTTTGRKDT